VATTPPVAHRDGKVIDLMEALRRSLGGRDAGAREGAKRFFARKGEKAQGKTGSRKRAG